MASTAQLTYLPHPLLQRDMQQRQQAIYPEESIGSWLRRAAIPAGYQPLVVEMDGQVIDPEQYEATLIHTDSLVVVRPAMKNGDGSDPVRTVLTLAILAYAPGWGTALAKAAGLGASAVAGAAFGTGISMLGMAAVNALRPPPKPDLSQARGNQPSATYSLSQTQNRPRHYQPMLLVLGEHRVVLDSASTPVTEYIGNGDEQLLWQVFHAGLGDIEIDQFLIGETPISDYGLSVGDGITLSNHVGELPEWPSNVTAIAGVTLQPGTAVVRTTPANTTRIAVDISGQCYAVGSNGLAEEEAHIQVQCREVGSSTWIPLTTGNVTAFYDGYWSRGYWGDDPYGPDNNPGQVWWQLGYDGASPNLHTEGSSAGSEQVNGIGLQPLIWRYIPRNAVGQRPHPPFGYIQTVPHMVIRNDNSQPVRRTVVRNVAAGQYEVRIAHINYTEGDEAHIQKFAVQQIKAYQPDTAPYHHQTRVGLRLVADGRLNGAIDAVSAVIRNRVQLRTGTGQWRTAISSNPAWQFLHFARGARDANGQRLWGAVLPDERIDIPTLTVWAAFCEQHQLQCNLVLDSSRSCDETLQLIAQTGRATTTWAAGILGVVWQAEDDAPVQLFNMANIVAGSFEVSYQNPPLPSSIETNYPDRAHNWQTRNLRVPIPNGDDALDPLKMELIGVTDAEQARRDTNLFAASQYYHRRKVRFSTDMAGMSCQRGQVIILSHDLTGWGYSGRLVGGSSAQLQLDGPVPFTEGAEHWVLIEMPNGYLQHRQVVAQSGSHSQLTLTQPLTNAQNQLVAPNDDDDPRSWRWCFEPTATPGKRVRIIDYQPQDEHHIQLLCVDEVPAYYQQENALSLQPPPTEYQWQNSTVEGVSITEITVTSSGLTRVILQPILRNAIGFQLRIRTNQGATHDYGIIYGQQWEGSAMRGDILTITLCAVALGGAVLPSGCHNQEHTVQGQTLNDASAGNVTIEAPTAPTKRDDTTELKAGDLWFNPDTDVLRRYNGADWGQVVSTTEWGDINGDGKPDDYTAMTGGNLLVDPRFSNAAAGSLVWRALKGQTASSHWSSLPDNGADGPSVTYSTDQGQYGGAAVTVDSTQATHTTVGLANQTLFPLPANGSRMLARIRLKVVQDAKHWSSNQPIAPLVEPVITAQKADRNRNVLRILYETNGQAFAPRASDGWVTRDFMFNVDNVQDAVWGRFVLDVGLKDAIVVVDDVMLFILNDTGLIQPNAISESHTAAQSSAAIVTQANHTVTLLSKTVSVEKGDSVDIAFRFGSRYLNGTAPSDQPQFWLTRNGQIIGDPLHTPTLMAGALPVAVSDMINEPITAPGDVTYRLHISTGNSANAEWRFSQGKMVVTRRKR